MLTGRESLIRLIGKRRRFLPNRESLLSTTIQSSLNLCKDGNGGVEGSSRQPGENGVEMFDFDWVTCPVCGSKVRGEDYMVNSHLDACLARGTKRKLSQRTLLQLNFCPRSKVKIHSTESEYIGTNVQTSPDKASGMINKLSDLGAEENGSIQCRSPLNSAYVIHSYKVGSAENPATDERINYKVESPSLLPENEIPKNGTADSMDDISGVLLATFIVGRRFGDEVDLNPGASISLLRDPDNAKDPNAIKILDAVKCLVFSHES